jgi:hypothetical protein
VFDQTSDQDQAPPATAPAPTIHPRQVFTVPQLRDLLRLNPSTLDREIRKGRLRCSLRAGRRFVLGAWALEWIARGEVRRRAGRNGAGGP